MRLTIPTLICITLLLTLVMALPALAEPNHFQQGIEAFKAEDYPRALDHFNRAREAGNRSANLAYNRAVTLYRLDRLTEASEAFSELTDDERWGDLARYNLGLIAQAQGDSRAAQFWYAQVVQEADNTKLQQLARQKLVALVADREQRTATGKKGALLFNLGLASDSNAANLADELASRSGGKEDIYTEGLGYGHYYLSGEKDRGTKLYGLAYTRDFQDYDSFNARILGAGLARERPLGSAIGELGARLTHTRVDGQVLADQVMLSASVRRPLSNGRLSAGVQTSYFSAGDDYGYIEGWQHQLELGARWVHNRVTLTPKVQWQSNNREDRETETQRTSYSPTKFNLMVDLDWQLTPEWTLKGGVSYSRARYDGNNRLTDLGGVERDRQRENTQRQWHLGARYGWSPRRSLTGQYRYTRSDDTFDLYEHDKQVVGLKLEYALQ